MKFYKKNILHYIIAICVFILIILLSFAFERLNIKNENSLMIFLTGVLIIVVETGSYLAGFITSVVCIAIYNYFFTAPYHSFLIYDVNNVISLYFSLFHLLLVF